MGHQQAVADVGAGLEGVALAREEKPTLLVDTSPIGREPGPVGVVGGLGANRPMGGSVGGPGVAVDQPGVEVYREFAPADHQPRVAAGDVSQLEFERQRVGRYLNMEILESARQV